MADDIVSVLCPRCEGTGKVRAMAFSEEKRKNPGLTTCHICKGKGRLDDIDATLASLRSQLSASESARVKAEEALAAVADDSPAAERLKLFKAAIDSRDSALTRATAAEARVAGLETALRECEAAGERGYTLGGAGARAALITVRAEARSALTKGPSDGK